MAVWQVDFYIVPRSALASGPQRLSAAILDATAWWSAATFAPDYRTRLPSVAPVARSMIVPLESWGDEDGNRVDVWSENGRVRRAMARVDVRRLDSRFGAALLFFVQSANAVLVRTDGLVVAPTIASFAAALRSAPAWRYANDPAEFIAGRMATDDDPE